MSRSKFLKVNLVEKTLIETIMKKCEEWRCCACSSLKDVEEMLNRRDVFNRLHSNMILDIEQLRTKVESAANTGHSLGFDFPEIPLLRNAASTLSWCSKVLVCRVETPSLEVTLRKLVWWC